MAKKSKKDQSFLDRIQSDLQTNQSYLNLVLGTLIVIVLAVLVFNYFNRPAEEVGPSMQTQNTSGDVSKENLPGKYTVKEGDTLFTIAQNYYNDGYKYPELVKTNNLANENAISSGQVLEIPKLEDSLAKASPTTEASPAETSSPTPSASPIADDTQAPSDEKGATGGAENQTIWGEKITGNEYTVSPGDWLSTIAGRAYGDIYAYEKIAKENNISDPNLIEVGTKLKLPR